MWKKTFSLSLFVLFMGAGCGSRPVMVEDSGPNTDRDSATPLADIDLDVDAGVDISTTDAMVDLAGTLDAGTAPCKQLQVVGNSTLGKPPPAMNTNAAMTHNGQGFAAVWVSGVSDSNQLLFSRLDYAGKVQGPKDVVLEKTVSTSSKPLIVHVQGGYSVFYEASSGAFISRFGDQGKVLAKHSMGGPVEAVALAPYPSGYAVLYSPMTFGASTLIFARSGVNGLAGGQTIDSGGFYWYPWMAPRAGGFAAAWGDSFVLLDLQGAPQGSPVKTLASKAVSGPAYTAAPGGYGVVYARSSDFFMEGQRLDADGKQIGKPEPIAPANIGAAALQQLFLSWTGSQYFLAYPGESGEPRVQILDSNLVPVGDKISLPSCLSWSSGPESAAFGAGRFAVAYTGILSGPIGAAVCVAIVECK